jgi:hypothetical protein
MSLVSEVFMARVVLTTLPTEQITEKISQILTTAQALGLI